MTVFAVVVLALALGPAFLSAEKPADEELQLISPHWDGIRHEFGDAFEVYYREKYKKNIRLVWLDVGGGTSEITKYLTARYKPESGTGVDILFGGGMDILPDMAKKGLFEAYPLSAEQLALIPENVNNQELRDKEFRYHAACLASFGFVYNTWVIERAKLPTPRTWDDLAAPQFQGWVSCGNPAQSGSLHMAFELILQGQGWERGYTTLARMASNVRAFNEGGTSVPRDVSLGQAAVGPCIDFYASAPIRRQGAAHLQLVIPQGMAVATPDCIAVLKTPPNKRAAFAFMDFVLSEAGQRLWYQARGEPGGPKTYDLERLPVMPSVYEMGLKTYTVTNPFKNAPDFKFDSKKSSARWTVLNDLWRGTMIDVHDFLWDARDAVVKAGRDADLGIALGQAPMSEQALLDLGGRRLGADQRNALRNKWSAWARERFRAIRFAAETTGPVPDFKAAPVD